ncbi:hypothetical protein QMK19_18070 [Streptomyces sp. H10-C2]|uniref:hypothetical protein n=1 Tax=unclassified Streptomyces TaxID=2593676 RepID=UPI0024BB598F|nr:MULTISPECIES: hypothetical protein [unclassified Streptomyces]MDJ0343459.1 hypothetical protein [Streptomyces sp. PH10-H1]MDJ0371539.1 hypothetical protein [Streptomyces sp. H10-C2]
MAATVNVPVLVGSVPLLYVQSMTINEGYRIERIMGSRFSQATQPTNKTIAIEAVLLGPQRLEQKKALEAMALTSRSLVAAAATGLAATGIPVVSGLTISLDMQVIDLRFTQSVARRDALDVSITLQHVPRSTLTAVLSEVADLGLGVATASVPTAPASNPIARTPGAPI